MVGARVGKGCPERGCGCTLLLLPPRAKGHEGGQEDAGRGEVPRMGALGLVPPDPRCRWEPLQTPLLGPWGSLRQKQEEKQLEGGVWFRAISPLNGENSNRTQSERARGWQAEGGSGPPRSSDPG